MSKFSNGEIKELLKLFENELGLKVSPEEACQHAAQLVDLLRVVYRDAQDNSTPP